MEIPFETGQRLVCWCSIKKTNTFDAAVCDQISVCSRPRVQQNLHASCVVSAIVAIFFMQHKGFRKLEFVALGKIGEEEAVLLGKAKKVE